MPPGFVLDAWPILEWLKQRQTPLFSFHALLKDAQAGRVKLVMSKINLNEAAYGIRKAPGLTAQARTRALETLQNLPLDIASVSDQLVDDADKCQYPISYADAVAAPLAAQLRVPLVTGDREFRHLASDGLLQLHWVGA